MQLLQESIPAVGRASRSARSAPCRRPAPMPANVDGVAPAMFPEMRGARLVLRVRQAYEATTRSERTPASGAAHG